MNELDLARRTISEVDLEMAALFSRRMEAVKRVAAYKKERGLPVYDPAREDELIRKNAAGIADPLLREYYVRFLRDVMATSRAFQTRLISGARIAYSGIPGAFAAEAVTKLFPDGEPVPCPDFASAYRAVTEGDCDCAVLPIENSTAGEVGAVCDLIFSGPLYINNILDLAVVQNLLALPGAAIGEIRTVVSHPQALAQCAPYIREHGFETREYGNTAEAARYVAETGDPSLAAIGTAEAAKLCGLNVLAAKINEVGQNTTRFAVLSRAENDAPGREDDNFFLVFSVKNQAGSLAEAIRIIGNHGYNMRSLHSRPLKTLLWNYYFYVEGEGNIRCDNGRDMLEQLSGVCDKLKLVGSYSPGKAAAI
ncbi:MAG: chorismate mutase [Clostridia bacterium]|nr:chorismate mutase [Clostridia bacterium]